jgi:uncharacterized sulfatase
MTRRDLLKTAALLPAAARAAATRRPNIILVLMDDLGYGQFGPNSDMFDLEQLNPFVLERDIKEVRPEAALEAAKTAAPNLNRLTKEGTRFTDAYVACPLCAPSRSAIMTSRYPQRFGGYINRDIERGGVPTDQVLPAQLLQKSGYRTAVIGKWHLARMKGGMDAGGGQHPLDRGFDYFFGFNGCCSTYYDAVNLYRNREKAQPEGYLTDQFTAEALRFVRNGPKDKPFFLYLPYSAVHGPLGKPAPDRYLKRFHTGSTRVDNFYAYLNAADDGVGQIRSALAEQGQENNTLIFLISDNGAPGGSPIPSNGPFLGFKGQVWQGGVRVPMVAWGKGLAQPGKISHEPVISMDIMATALAAAGLEPPAGYDLDGRNLLPLLAGRQKQPVHECLFWAGQLAQKWVNSAAGLGDEMTAPPAWAARKGRWMLRYWSHIDRHELYDLETDRGERKDVAAQHPDTVGALRAEYARWYKNTKPPMDWDEKYWKVLAPKNS